MQPEQMRAARSLLNWSLERLAEESGVHRNTLSNFETRKYLGDPEKLAVVKRTLESAGVIFIEESGEAAGVRLRKFQIGDLVRFRPQTRVRFDYNIAADEVGKVVGVEPDPPRTGPTYMIQVQFPHALVPYVFRFEYELVRITPDEEGPIPSKCRDKAMTSDPRAIIDEFCIICERVWMDYELYQSLCETDHRNVQLFISIAPMFFHAINGLLCDNMFLQFCRVTDPANQGKNRTNLTCNYILEKISWPDVIHQQLQAVNRGLMDFRAQIEDARSKRIAHVDLSAQIETTQNLGAFPKGADRKFLQYLQEFINIAYGHLNDGHSRPINVAMSTDTHQLVRALEKSVIFDRCSKCSENDRVSAILDYEGFSA